MERKVSEITRQKNAERMRRARQIHGYQHTLEIRYADPQYKIKESARAKIKNALRAGRITKPSNCQMCGKVAKLEGHHHRGYDHPMDVVWLCHRCHAKIEIKNNHPPAPLIIAMGVEPGSVASHANKGR